MASSSTRPRSSSAPSTPTGMRTLTCKCGCLHVACYVRACVGAATTIIMPFTQLCCMPRCQRRYGRGGSGHAAVSPMTGSAWCWCDCFRHFASLRFRSRKGQRCRCCTMLTLQARSRTRALLPSKSLTSASSRERCVRALGAYQRGAQLTLAAAGPGFPRCDQHQGFRCLQRP